jgi:hypothetical protein
MHREEVALHRGCITYTSEADELPDFLEDSFSSFLVWKAPRYHLVFSKPSTGSVDYEHYHSFIG